MMIQKRENKLFVQLSSTIDDSRIEQMSNNVKIEELYKPDGTAFFEINSLKEAKDLCFEFISKYKLTSSNWMGGLVVDKEFNFMAKISYNGRVWDNINWLTAKEIEI